MRKCETSAPKNKRSVYIYLPVSIPIPMHIPKPSLSVSIFISIPTSYLSHFPASPQAWNPTRYSLAGSPWWDRYHRRFGSQQVIALDSAAVENFEDMCDGVKAITSVDEFKPCEEDRNSCQENRRPPWYSRWEVIKTCPTPGWGGTADRRMEPTDLGTDRMGGDGKEGVGGHLGFWVMAIEKMLLWFMELGRKEGAVCLHECL